MFSVVSFLITLRETIEAALIIGILLVYVVKIEQKKLRKDIWIGTAVGIIVSIGAAFAFNYLLGGFEQYEEVIEGFSMIFAAILLSWMIVWMRRIGKDIQHKLESRIEQSIKSQQRLGIISLAFISVLREGIETVIFLTGIEATGETPMAILWSSLFGIAVAVILAFVIFLSGKKINLKMFFNITSIVLLIFAAGMLAHGVHELQELGWFGSESHFFQQVVWDTSGVLNDKTSELGLFLRALFGYQDKPTWLELITYIGYYLILSAILVTFSRLNKRKQLKSKMNVENKQIPSS
jgi:high-affinity iron transporter